LTETFSLYYHRQKADVIFQEILNAAIHDVKEITSNAMLILL